MSSTSQFGEVSKDEHHAIRDTLRNLIQAFRVCNLARVRRFIVQAAALAGPHFRYEEESLYPALAAVLDDEQVHKLLNDHERAIEAVRNLVELAAQAELTEQEAETGAQYARSLLPHVIECDGLSIMAELLPEPAVRQILETRDRSRRADLDLLRWADTVRHSAT